jgi:hypothetical protein
LLNWCRRWGYRSDTRDIKPANIFQEDTMRRERALKVVLILVGLLFTAMVYPLVLSVKQEPALAMMMSLYVTLGIFLLVSIRKPSANRNLIAFTA